MDFTDQQLKDIQFFNSPHYNVSATFNVCLVMENSQDIYNEINRLRRIDGTATGETMRAVFNKFKIEVDEWAQGEVNFDELANIFNDDFEAPALPDIIRTTLQTVKIIGNKVFLPSSLARADYQKIDAILQALGGKWSKKEKSHVFDEKDPEEEIACFLETGKLDKPNNFGFFPTPKELAQQLVDKLQLTERDKVLEPEAGIGNLALLAADVVGVDNVTCYELQSKHCATLRKLGFDPIESDFLSVTPTRRFTAVVMNPPFEKQQDIDHVMHACKFLAPGGRLGAIMSASLLFRSNKKTVAFNEFLRSMGAVISENQPDAFKSSGTMARTVSITLTWPDVKDDVETTVIQPALVATSISPVTVRKSEMPIELATMRPRAVQPPSQIGFDF